MSNYIRVNNVFLMICHHVKTVQKLHTHVQNNCWHRGSQPQLNHVETKDALLCSLKVKNAFVSVVKCVTV